MNAKLVSAPRRLSYLLLLQPLHGVTGGVQGPGTYSPWHSDHDYCAIPASWVELQTQSGLRRTYEVRLSREVASLCMRHCSTMMASLLVVRP